MEMAGCWHENRSSLVSASFPYLIDLFVFCFQAVGMEILYQENKGRSDVNTSMEGIRSSVREHLTHLLFCSLELAAG